MNRLNSTNSISTKPMSLAAFTMVGMFIAGTGGSFTPEKVDQWKQMLHGRVAFTVNVHLEHDIDIRTVAEHVVNIRSILNLVDMADLFDVSRQSVHKWLNGASTPENDKHLLIRKISSISDQFRSAGIDRGSYLVKMKTFSGKSLLDLIKEGGPLDTNVRALIIEATAMEAAYQKSEIERSRAKTTNDWMASVSIPAASEDNS